MVAHRIILWTAFLSRFQWSAGNQNSSSDMEMPMTTAWMSADWFSERSTQEIVAEDEGSGCICRMKLDHVVCYGATSCSSFPKNLTVSLRHFDLRLKTTAIIKLSAGSLDGFRHLRRLDIDANFRLSEIEPGFFADMTSVVNMSISFNKELKSLREDTFRGLDNLERLKMIKNGFRNVLDVSRALKPSLLPRIETLSLSENVFREVNEEAFADLDGTRIREFDLILCQIEKIHPDSLKPFKSLEKLRLGMNAFDLNELERLFDSMAKERIPVRLLNLYELGFRKGARLTSLLRKISKLNVTHLNLRRNHIENLYEGLFPFMPHLQALDLREVSAVNIEPNAFDESVMPRLKTLLLGGNKLSGVTTGVLLPQLSELDLSENTGISHVPSYFDVNSNIFENMTNLITLNLSFNSIATISNSTFNGVHNLRVLGLKNATIFYIAKNSFVMLRNLFLLNMENNPFGPFNTFPELIFEGLDRLEVLMLANCKITYFLRGDIFSSLSMLKYLNLKGNNLVRMDAELFASLPRLTAVDISSNHLTPWDYPQLFRGNLNLKVLLLDGNRFTYLTFAMMDDFAGIPRLDISGNPYVCDRILSDAVNSWLSSQNLAWKDTDLFDEPNVCLSPDVWRDRPLIAFLTSGNDSATTVPPDSRIDGYVFGIVFLFVSLSAVLAVSIYYRWRFHYWIFLLKSKFPGILTSSFGKSRGTDEVAYTYDAFVSYSHEDRNFVVRLISELENEEPYLKLCVYERDFEIGTIISDTVLSKVSASRKIMFVVSNSFAKSQWCLWEMQIAEYHRIFFKNDTRSGYPNDSPVLIKLGPIMECFVTPTLRYMLRTRIYLEWTPDCNKEKIFWEKLRNYLASSKATDHYNC